MEKLSKDETYDLREGVEEGIKQGIWREATEKEMMRGSCCDVPIAPSFLKTPTDELTTSQICSAMVAIVGVDKMKEIIEFAYQQKKADAEALED